MSVDANKSSLVLNEIKEAKDAVRRRLVVIDSKNRPKLYKNRKIYANWLVQDESSWKAVTLFCPHCGRPSPNNMPWDYCPMCGKYVGKDNVGEDVLDD